MELKSDGNHLDQQVKEEKKFSHLNGDDPYFSLDSINIETECDRCVLADQRIFYLHRRTRLSYWMPPRVAWKCLIGLDYGLEKAVDEFGTHYFINHLTQTTSYHLSNSRKSTLEMATSHSLSSDSNSDQIVVPPTRSYEIWRSPRFNYGFIASSERPVIIQFVTPDGPSAGKLLPKDQILSVNGIDVRHEDKLGVVEMIRKSTTVLKLEVAQPPRRIENGTSSSSSRRVRFTERIIIAGSNESNSIPKRPNVLKIYMENGQIKSLKYNNETTVQEILNSLTEKLQITQPNYFALGIEQSISLAPARISFLPNKLRVQSFMSSSFSDQLRCRLRLAFPPRELLGHSKDDPFGFDYFYQQCVNDFVDGRNMEIRYEASLRLAALQIRQVCMDSNTLKPSTHINVYSVEREYGLATFLPTIWLEKVKPRDLREHLQFFLNKDEETFNDLKQYLSKQKALNRTPDFLSKNSVDVTADIARILRIKYVTLISLLPDFGIVYFNVNYKPTNVDMLIQIDSRYGLIVRYPGKSSPPAITISFTSIDGIHVYEENEMTSCLCLKLAQSGTNYAQRNLEFFVDKKDLDNLVTYILGFSKLAGNQGLDCYEEKPSSSITAPPYRSLHFVSPAGWNYASTVDPNIEKAINFAHGTPSFEQAIVSTNQYDSVIQAEESIFPLCNDSNASRRISKNSLAEPEFIDESPTVEMNPMPRASVDKFKALPPTQQRRRSSQQRFTQMLVGTAQAILRNRVTTKRIRDSIRIHKQRHSVPNANANSTRSVSPIAERRWSSATRRDTIASTCSTNENPCISRSALALRTSFDNITTNGEVLSKFSLDSSPKAQSSNRTASLLKLPSVVTRFYSNSSSTERQSTANKAKQLKASNKSTSLKPNPQKNRLVEELRRSYSLDEKHVRFDFSSNSIILPPPSPDPSISPEDYPNKNPDDEFFFQPYVTLCTKKFGQLSTSRTFPMDGNQEFGEDFVPRSYRAAETAREPINPAKPTVRRMSLKEFTGLENAAKPLNVPRHNSAAFQNGIESPILGRLQMNTLANQPSISQSTENLDNYASRRRSSSALYGANLGGSREHVYEPFDRVINEINELIDGLNLDSNQNANDIEKLPEPLQDFNSDQMLARIDLARKRLSITLEKMPTQSPKKRAPVDVERNKILVDIGKLSQASKHLIRSVYAPIGLKERQENTGVVIQLADNITKQCEGLVEKRNSFYQAHLLKAELDQLLRSLSETIKDANLAVDKPRYGAEFRRLAKSSNALAASFSQLLRAIKTF